MGGKTLLRRGRLCVKAHEPNDLKSAVAGDPKRDDVLRPEPPPSDSTELPSPSANRARRARATEGPCAAAWRFQLEEYRRRFAETSARERVGNRPVREPR